ncbi:uncharacterized protein LOC132311439 [Cornus florida]|uniref:uncharacterized protein LOC132311439 n=1 Tax=Cornus florida TaxID=4283 RepID=UPI0028A07D4E|nr:uncharacterized protein LOC132311439 [Cornus florida]
MVNHSLFYLVWTRWDSIQRYNKSTNSTMTRSEYLSHKEFMPFQGLSHLHGSIATMSKLCPIFFTLLFLSSTLSVVHCSAPCFPHHYVQQINRKFEQKTDRFWEFEEQSNSWVEVKLPYDIVSCINGNCTKLGLIDRTKKNETDEHMEREIKVPEQRDGLKNRGAAEESTSDMVMPFRNRVSLMKMSDTSIWVTGESGAIYERFWNGVQWVIAPHDLPVLAGPAVSVFMVNQTILALSESGNLYQMQLSENSQPIWIEFTPTLGPGTSKEMEQNSAMPLKSGVISYNGERIYFCTKDGSLLELNGVEPPRWVNHGRPPGADVAAIADAATIRPEVVFTVSSIGDLYEYDRSSKPSWKKHVWREGSAQDTYLMPLMGSPILGLSGAHSISLYLLTKGGNLVERRLHQRKWKWIVHGSPKNHHLTSITPVWQEELNEKSYSIFFTTASGTVFEYRVAKHSGTNQENQILENWASHMHPPNAKAARGIAGLQFQVGRILFPLDDGRLAELHLPGLGGENSGPTHQVNIRRKASLKYVWSIIDAPESEGWNAEYCTEERGPSNCITGIKDEPNLAEISRSTPRRRKGSKAELNYLTVGASASNLGKVSEEYNVPKNWINTNFRLRVMHESRSFFLVTDGGLTLEYLNTENVWLWLRHDHSTAMKGALGSYNGSLFVVDEHGSLLIRERSGNELGWINCTSMRKGRHVIGGPPWDGIPGRVQRVTPVDASFFVSKSGRLQQFTVSLRKFKWKDCRNPPNTKIASIVDQELFRENIVFVVGKNGRLYQYNKVTELWHEHYQSQHLLLSGLPGTAMRESSLSLTGSLFMLSEDGGLVEYHWNTLDGWNWVEHGTPDKTVTLAGSPGPCFGGNQLFLIGSDGKVYLRYLDQTTWKWKNFGFPFMKTTVVEDPREAKAKSRNEEVCTDEDFAARTDKNEENLNDINKNCDPKVASTRPIPFAEDSVIFELRDSRLAELRRTGDMHWQWLRTIGTPTSLCIANYWTALAS